MKHNKVGFAMTRDVVRAGYPTPFQEVARLLVEGWISGLPVVDEDDKVIGVIVVEGVRGPLTGQSERRSRTEIAFSMTSRSTASSRWSSSSPATSMPPACHPDGPSRHGIADDCPRIP
ncbi:CBS domain-containing protein [Streptomyces sp. DSM 41699]|uniref:CBS domain-containing protein n=1 Tax=Streptomyces gibsoniae TaxID=3075529 RepID=A0ABU2U2H2_9ACTN|nr:CBS domain-containing protein [Streptomyces sp. DSM 41699]MDT0467420.1 CBS domain-containing protein [Streptomyces sp. DSM 41699]